MKQAALEEEPVGDNKYFEPVYKLLTGLPVVATLGLNDRMCVDEEQFHKRMAKGVNGIQEEVDDFASGSTDPYVLEVKSLLHYIRFEATGEKQYTNGVRDLGRGQMMLSNFMENQKARLARLSWAELVAMRLYTTTSFMFMNGPLRDDARYERGEQCPLPVTTHFAWTGIKKLRSLHVDSHEMTLWRGMRNLEVADEFMTKGGTELAFMSTTQDLRVAVRYCLSKQALLFKIVSPSFMTIGADVQWLSAFPSEKEILYPPLTFLKPTGRSQVVASEGVVCGEANLGAARELLWTFTRRVTEFIPEVLIARLGKQRSPKAKPLSLAISISQTFVTAKVLLGGIRAATRARN